MNTDFEEADNHSPMSTNPCLSKAIETLFKEQINEFLNRYNLRSKTQTTFTEKRSTLRRQKVFPSDSYEIVVDREISKGRLLGPLILNLNKKDMGKILKNHADWSSTLTIKCYLQNHQKK